MTLFMGRGATMRFLLTVLAALLCPSIAQEQRYEVHDENNNNNNNGAAPDYTQYYAPAAVPEAKAAAAAPDDSAGFVSPIDFTALFGAASGIGVFGGVPAAAPRQVFSPVEVNPFQLAANPPALFPAPAVQAKANDNGFTNPQVQFQSLFDASGAAASEVGFRPQDFLKPAARATEEEKPTEEASGYYSPSYAKSQDAYESRPGPSYTYKAVPAATSYRAAPAEEEDDEDDEEDSSYHSSYEPKQKSSSAPAEEEEEEEEEETYSFKPKLKTKKSEYLSSIGKSSYPEKYQYRYTPPEGSPAPKTKSTYQNSEYPESKAAYAETPSSDYYEHVKQKSTPSDAYEKPEVYRPPAAKHRLTDTSDIIYGKGKAPAYYAPESRRTEEPHEGKSSYPAPAEYNPKKLSSAYYDPKERAPVQFTPKSAPVYSTEERKAPKVKEEEEEDDKEIEEEEDEEESREEEEKAPAPDVHGPPEYAPSGTKTDKKTCKKINKRLTADDVAKGRFRRDAMTCYQCDDPKTGGTFEQCSYSSDPKSRSYFLGRAQKYRTSASSSKPTAYRYRRYLGDNPFGEELETAETLARMVRELPRDEYYFNPEYITSERADEYKPPGTNIDQKHCRKVKKDSMTCMVCKDPKTGGDYEQCAYSEKPKERNYFVSRESSFSSKKQPKSERRYVESPYSAYNTRPRSRHTREKPSRKSDSFASGTEVRTEEDKEHSSPYRYRNNDKGSGSSEKESGAPFRYRSSEDTSESPGKESSSPFRYRSNGDESESSGKESSSPFRYRSGDHKSEDSGKESGTPFRYRSNEDESESSGKESSTPFRYRSNEDESESSGKESSAPFRYRSNEEESEESEGSGKGPNTPFRYRSDEGKSDGSGKELHLTGQTYDEYFSRLFPELQRRSGHEPEKYTYPSESKPEEEKQPVFEYKSPLPDYYTDTANKKDLEKVLGEFRQKDRSSCKKVMKDKMTCYKCVDKKGTQHEECMFVAASQPKKSHLAYQEVKEFRLAPPPGVKAPDSDSSSSSNSGKKAETSVEKDDYSTTSATPTATAPPKRKAFFKKVSTTPTPDNKYDETAEKLELLKLNAKDKTPGVKLQVTRRSSKTSTLSTTTTPLTTRSSSSKGRVQDAAVSASEQRSQKVKPSKAKEEDPELPPEAFSPDGLYAAETRNKFDPVLKITLPAYMLQRSEHEAIFDEVMASGRRR